ncbi:MAG TPA: hypothetical protein VHS99_10680 [Chloroflexota bacterium]|jgi:uncharacterized membrane protein YidH (DUF202 family)|nr:hypothetical protein [Chloroflexota bacterium]
MAGLSVAGVRMPERVDRASVSGQRMSEAGALASVIVAIGALCVLGGAMLLIFGIATGGAVVVQDADGEDLAQILVLTSVVLIVVGVAMVVVVREVFKRVRDVLASLA